MLFKKKDKVPEIPPAPQIPDAPDKEIKDLPELADSSSNFKAEEVDNQMIKSAVSEDEIKSQEFAGESFKEYKVPEFEERKTLEVSQSSMPIDNTTMPMSPVFVRIDKFNAAKKDFEDIKKKAKDIDTVLRRIKEVKMKEDIEINEWGNEIEKIKARLAEIDSQIFNKL